MTSNQKGAIAELAIAATAAKHGIIVSRPLTEGQRYDLIFDLGDKLLRVQCKSAAKVGTVIPIHVGGCYHSPRGYVRSTYDKSDIDAVAAYCPDLDRCYLLPMDLVARKTYLHLRLGPTKNNQSIGVKWAAHYEFGAVAQLGERRHGMPKAEGSSPSSSIQEAALPGGLF